MAKIRLKVIKNLDDIARVAKGIKNVNRALFTAATLSKKELVSNWLSGKGGDGRSWQGRGLNQSPSELSPGYKLSKASAGKDPIPNMHFKGQMVRSLIPGRTQGGAELKFRGGDNNKKATNNYNLRPNMFILSTAFKNKMVKLIRKKVIPFS